MIDADNYIVLWLVMCACATSAAVAYWFVAGE